MITLPDRLSDAGVEARVLLAECPGPGDASYTFEAASEAMQLPSPGRLVAWRTANRDSPGKGFLLFKSVLGNDFYYQ